MRFDWSSGAVGLVLGIGLTLSFATFSQLLPGVCGNDEPSWVCGREWLVAIATSIAAISASFALLEWSARQRGRRLAIARAKGVVGEDIYGSATNALSIIDRYLKDDPENPVYPVMNPTFVTIVVNSLRITLSGVRSPLLKPVLAEDDGELHDLTSLIETECLRVLKQLRASTEIEDDVPPGPIPDLILQNARVPLRWALVLAERLDVVGE